MTTAILLEELDKKDNDKELENLYLEYFSPPSSETTDAFTQVSLFDYSIEIFTTNATSK